MKELSGRYGIHLSVIQYWGKGMGYRGAGFVRGARYP